MSTAEKDTIPSFDNTEAGIIDDTELSLALRTAHSPFPNFQKDLPLTAAMVENIPPIAVVIDFGGF